jgi:hypothetical protein
MLPNEMERRLSVEDRGPVDVMSDGRMRWVISCGRCFHTAHIVIKGEYRLYACPRCLVLLDHGSNKFPSQRPESGNRIRNYFDDEKERYGRHG